MTTTLAPNEAHLPSDTSEPVVAVEKPRVSGVLGDLKPTLLMVTALMFVVVVAVGVALALHTTPVAGDVSVSETDYRIAMPTTLHAGKHVIAFTNNGAQPHELLLYRTDLRASALPVDATGDVVEDSPLMHNVVDSGKGLRPGATEVIPVTLAPGHYVAACNLPDHYRMGMRLDITVTR
jgi:uncharacterized cupredoxin-like copper-binding protein